MADAAPGRLDGWKAIAAYLGKNERTVQRWAKDLAMPVHHVHGRKTGTVYANADELEAWVRLNPLPDAATHPEREDTPDPFRDLTDALAADPASQRSRWWRSRWTAAATVLTLCLGLGGLTIVRALHPGPPTRVTFSGNTLLAWDERGRLAWTYQFPADVRAAPPADVREPIRLVDLDGDGRNEIVAVIAFPRGDAVQVPRQVIHCFSPTGELLWRYEPQMTLRFGGHRWEGPWKFTDLLVSPDAPKTVWAAVAHHTWWQAFVVRLDPHGQASVRLINSGVIFALNYMRNASGTYVLAGGVNNGYGAGILAVLDVTQGPTVSPQAAGRYHCDTCPDGHPHRYFVFPPTELNRLLWPYNDVTEIRVLDRRIQVITNEVPHGATTNGFYELSDTFDVETVALSDGYPTTHAILEHEGKVTHSFEDCPERTHPKLVRRWDATGMWTDVPAQWALLQQ